MDKAHGRRRGANDQGKGGRIWHKDRASRRPTPWRMSAFVVDLLRKNGYNGMQDIGREL